MNVALTTVLIICIFLPGLVFRRAYLSEPFSYKYISNNILFDLANAIIPSLLLHIIGIAIVENFTKYNVDLYTLEKLFGPLNHTIDNSPFKNIQNNYLLIGSYFFLVILTAFFLGHLLRNIVIQFNLDIKYRFFHFDNEWYYLFTARYLEVDKKDGVFIFLDILVETQSDPIIYKGILEYFTLAKGGGLDSIRLINVKKQRLRLNSDSSKTEDTVAKSEDLLIPGNSIVFPMHQIKNINIRYMSIETGEDSKEK